MFLGVPCSLFLSDSWLGLRLKSVSAIKGKILVGIGLGTELGLGLMVRVLPNVYLIHTGEKNVLTFDFIHIESTHQSDSKAIFPYK